MNVVHWVGVEDAVTLVEWRRLPRDEAGIPVLSQADERALLRVARGAIAGAVSATAVPDEHILHHAESCGVFVTLRTADGSLRGCVGNTVPLGRSLHEEVARTAVASATQDPRFPPLEPQELDGLRIEISLLGQFQEVASPDELDPQRFGVLATQGRRRGVLLPQVDGVDSVDTQLEVVAQKAGFQGDAPVRLMRFGTRKFRED